MASELWDAETLAEFDAAIAAMQGVRKVEFSDQTIEFQPISQILRLRARIAAEVQTPSRVRFAQTSKGITGTACVGNGSRRGYCR